MTFLLQKFNAINRTRTEVRARNGLRSSASGIAFTGRLAACLLLAGFLGVGSAMAQPKVLRLEGGELKVGIGENEVHHYLIDTDGDGSFTDETAVNNPTGRGGTETNTFLVGGLALVTWENDNPDTLAVSPIAAGSFKIAVSLDGDADLTDAGGANVGTPHEFVIVSANAPMLKDVGDGAAYNTGADGDVVSLSLTPRDETSKEYDLTDWFSDPNDVFLTYDTKVDMVAKEAPDTDALNALTAGNPLRAKVTKDGVAIVTAVPDGNKLTVALTDKAMGCQTNASGLTFCDQTDIWVFGRDGSEYARKRIQVNVGSSTNPYVMTPLGDEILREGAAADTKIDLAAGFDDPEDLTDTDLRNPTNMDATALTYKVSISDDSAAKVPEEVGTVSGTWVVPSMTATLTLTDKDAAEGVGHSVAMLSIRPRVAGSLTFTVEATDRGVRCRTGFTFVDEDTASRHGHDTPAGLPARCIENTGTRTEADSTGTYPDAKSVKDEFTVTVVTKTTPLATTNDFPSFSGDNELDADGDAKTVDLADLDTEANDAQAAFTDPTEQGLTYMAYTNKADSAFVVATVNGSVVTLTPVWRIGRVAKTATVKVKATNGDDESSTRSFSVTVDKATKPVVNHLVAPLLGVGYTLNTGDEPRVVNLRNLTDTDDPKMAVPLFIDPDAFSPPDETLPGGLLHKIQVSDVVADHVYENQSEENDITTSAMRIQLDPATAMLTITPTGANSASVTIWGIDRDRNMISATVMITVVSGVGTEGEELPTEVELSQNYPNPFNPQTTIDYALPQAGDVSLVVYDMLGREVDVLLDGPQAAGRHTVRFGANHLPNGTYVYRLVAGDKTITRTMVLVK